MKKKLVLFVITVLSLGAGSLLQPKPAKAGDWPHVRYFTGDDCKEGNRNYCLDDTPVPPGD
ncbi:MAG TPA: hypothetical protein DCM08_00745 [Microscillaceae bacterium]|nr:hypothetical protein [Microscillaceae bacterium]